MTDPLDWVPMARGAMNAATAAAEPLEEPPGVREGSCGFRVFPGEIDRKLGGDGLSQQDRARLAEQGDGGGVFHRPMSGVQDRAVLGRHVLRVEDVLDPHRNAVERTERLPFPPRQVRRARLVQGMTGVQVRPGADPLLERRDAVEAGAHQRFGGDPAVADRPGRLDGAQEGRIRRCVHRGHGVTWQRRRRCRAATSR